MSVSGFVQGVRRAAGTALLAMVVILGALAQGRPADAQNKLLSEAVEFTGLVLYLESGVPGLIIGATHGGETAVFGFGKLSEESEAAPDGDTIFRIGSLTKAFTGQVLASMVADGTLGFADPLQDHLGWGIDVPGRDGHAIRLIDLATHSSGLPREVEREQGPPDDPFRTLTAAAYAAALAQDPLMFAPGTGAFYSNFAFDVLSAALAHAGGRPYGELLRERVLDPAGMTDTLLELRPGDEERLLQGHNFDGSPLPDVPATPIMAGASSLYSTGNDILRWLAWHLDRFAAEGAETRLLDHAAYLQRDGLSPVYGLDESGHMDAMGLGWVIMMPDGDRPLILQKAGGLQGIFTYAAFSPTRGIGAFVVISEFDFATAMNMATVVNDLIATLAPR